MRGWRLPCLLVAVLAKLDSSVVSGENRPLVGDVLNTTALGDGICTWSYSHAECVPTAKCSYQFVLGDFTLSQSCRLKSDAPPSTEKCSWSLLHMCCVPASNCSYQYSFGDLTPSESCRPKHSTTPGQIHVALADVSGTGSRGMTVSWVTTADTHTEVRWGMFSGKLTETTMGTSSTYYESYDHHVLLDDLAEGGTYYYRVGDGTLFSNEHSFTVVPEDQENLRVIVLGDMGIYDSGLTRDLLQRLYPDVDFVYHLGDVGYADDAFLHGNPTEFKYEKVFNLYMNTVQPMTATKPYMVLPGNHEAECHSPACQVDPNRLEKLSNFSAFNHRFRMPSVSSGGTLNMWYSFDLGLVHFVSINTETDYPGSPNDEYTLHRDNGHFGNQLAWLKSDLEKAVANRSRRPWIIVAGHRPIYTIINCDKKGNPIKDSAVLQKAVEELLFTYKVDMYLSGHVHSYERHSPVYKNFIESSYTDPKYPVHVVTGAGGNSEGHQTFKGFPSQPWNKYRNDVDWGVSTMDVYNRTHLRWQFLSAPNGTVLDEFVLVQNGH